MSNVSLGLILEKIASKDKDFRYMATSDLLNELENPNFKTDSETEFKICSIILQQLEDSSSDISGLAVKCLGFLVNRVAEAQVGHMLQVLCQNLLSGKKEQQRDVASIGLKAIITEISGGSLALVAIKKAAPSMIQGVKDKDNSFDVWNACLDILHEIVRKFGVILVADDQKNATGLSQSLVDSLLPLLEEPRAGIRKRAIHCLAALTTYLGKDLLEQVCSAVLSHLEDGSASSDVSQAYLNTIGAISRAIGYRFGPYLPRAVPLIMKHISSAGEEDYESIENCLQAFESFVERSPQDSQAFLSDMLGTSLKFLAYDPNYAADDDMDADEDDDMDEDDNSGSDEEYSDDEDMSWKVRRSAAKCLTAIIVSYPAVLSDIYPKACPELIIRFKEREENVKSDVFATFTDLVRLVGMSESAHVDDDTMGDRPLELLRADMPSIMKAASRQLKEKSIKTKIGVLMVLKELLSVMEDAAEPHLDALIPGVINALQDKSSNSGLKIEALLFLNMAMAKSRGEVFQPYIPTLSKLVFAAVAERYYKVTSAALRLCEQMVRVLRPDGADAPIAKGLEGTAAPLFQAVMLRLSAQDQDQEVKDCAINCMSTIVALLGDQLTSEMSQVLGVLLERLRNEITRLTAVKAFCVIAGSSLRLDLSSVLTPVVSELNGFLRKANRTLRQASLDTLVALVESQEQKLDEDLSKALVEEAAALVDDSDVNLAALALKLCWTLTASQPSVTASVSDKVLPKAMILVKSPLLQAAGLKALQQFFAAMVKGGAPGASRIELQDALLGIGAEDGTPKSVQRSIAQCVAAVCIDGGDAQVKSTVDGILAKVKGGCKPSVHRMSLLVLGEIGRKIDLSPVGQGALQDTINAALSSQVDEIKSAGSMALGGVTVGSLQTYLPFLVEQISTQQASPKHQYLLLKALNEVIASISAGAGTDLQDAQQQHILKLLLGNAESEEECRHVVAECTGRLSLLNPTFVLPQLEQLVTSDSSAMRWLVVTAVRYMLMDQPSPVDATLGEALPKFLERMGDEDRHVRRAAVLTLSTAAFNKPSLVVKKLPGLLPMLYDQTLVREDLIRTVDLGPFKHKIDDGLELRKAAFECMDMVLDQCRGCLDLNVFLEHLQSGVGDHYDVKMPCHSMLAKLAVISPHIVLMSLEQLVEPLEKTLTVRLKSDAVKQEVDRNEDMLRSCLRAIDTLTQIPSVETCTRFGTFMTNIVTTGTLGPKYAAVKEERIQSDVNKAAAAGN